MITSTQNPKIKWARSLQASSKARREAGALVVEGVRLAEEAVQAGCPAQLVFYSPELNARGQALVEAYRQAGAPVEEVDERILRAASDTQAPQGLLAVVNRPEIPAPAKIDFAFIPDGVRDPGNLGTILRTAAAAGVQIVYLPPEGVDPFAPKVVRAGMGAHFRLPLVLAGWDMIATELRRAGLNVFLAAARQGQPYTAVDLRPPAALIIGGEAQGAGETARQLAIPLHIPMPGKIESLNAAIAAGILLFEVVRQRESS